MPPDMPYGQGAHHQDNKLQDSFIENQMKADAEPGFGQLGNREDEDQRVENRDDRVLPGHALAA